MLKGASGRDVVNAVKEKLPSIQKALPKGVELVPFYDRTDLVKKAINTVTKALAEGAVFVLIVLIVLLADVRSALIVTLILPLAALFAFIMMKWYGLSANLMSLGGLAIGIGMMVDGAVVMVENIHRHLTEPSDPARHQEAGKIETVLYAAKEVGRPIVFGIFIIILVFLPLFTLEGFEGKMFSPLAFTISFALLGSLIFSLTLVPTLCTFFLKQKPLAHDPFHIRWLKQIYLTALKPCVRHPGEVVLVALLPSEALRARSASSARNSCRRSMKVRSRCRPFVFPASRLPNRSPCKARRKSCSNDFLKSSTWFPKPDAPISLPIRWAFELSHLMVTLKPHEEWTTMSPRTNWWKNARGAERLPGVASSFHEPIALVSMKLVSGVKSAIGSDFRRRPRRY